MGASFITKTNNILNMARTLADDVTNSDFFTDAPEYAEAVASAKQIAQRILRLLGDPRND